MYLQLRKVRMYSAEMSNTCNEAQALLDSTIAQLYQTMTDACRENMKLNKMQDTDMEPLNVSKHIIYPYYYIYYYMHTVIYTYSLYVMYVRITIDIIICSNIYPLYVTASLYIHAFIDKVQHQF